MDEEGAEGGCDSCLEAVLAVDGEMTYSGRRSVEKERLSPAGVQTAVDVSSSVCPGKKHQLSLAEVVDRQPYRGVAEMLARAESQAMSSSEEP